MYLEDKLGVSTLVKAYRTMQLKGTSNYSDAEVEENVLSIVGYDNIDAIPLLGQLVAAETTLR